MARGPSGFFFLAARRGRVFLYGLVVGTFLTSPDRQRHANIY